jgi:hypothetical protein
MRRSLKATSMADAYVIQVSGRTAGIVARDSRDRSFNFFAAMQPFTAMEGRPFADPLAAERAARHLAKHGNLPRRLDQSPLPAASLRINEK